MNTVLNVVVAGRAARNAANVKNRQPLSTVYYKASTKLEEGYESIVLEELNVKSLEFAEDVSAPYCADYRYDTRSGRNCLCVCYVFCNAGLFHQRADSGAERVFV